MLYNPSVIASERQAGTDATVQADPLLARILAHELDDPESALPFTRRLARENRWELAFALRAVAEYKRFVYLAMTAGHEVTPSEQVDQVWHLHLLYTRDYWNTFCPRVLGRPLHHGPTRGGSAQGIKYRDQYQQTLDSYARVFGQPPPQDIWPSVEERFAAAGQWVYINRREVWLLTRPSRWLMRLFKGGI